ncbi:hypothetical protein BDW02DRAFT_505242 [Decorospora gaudefroyi]|uniref:WSC domain-containing protein n=1 Tax=Decorospora gaudefroyi TaxID=184978 RepID=A0A6A5K3T1_9PLEO|nr:hypothetical protein BDW02DRAFT_505242 [Decorospora gaudefroyi]
MEHRFSALFGLTAILALLLSIRPVGAVDWIQSYCSTQNTASDDVYTWDWQSNGNCTNHCKQEGSYAFAVLQYRDCWCSDYIPADQGDMSGCMVECPGYPTENCGNKVEDLYLYIQMDGKPSGTKGASTTAPESTAAPSPDAPSSKPPTQATSESSETSASEDDGPTMTEKPMTVPTVVTESGIVITRTVVITPTSPSTVVATTENKSNVGAIAGGVAGGIIGLIAIVGGILFVLWRKRKQQAQQGDGQEAGSAGISRNVSTMSRAGLLGGRNEKTPPPIVTNFGSQRSRHDDESITPITPSTRRFSQPILVDSRLNPNAVLTFHGATQSRESLGSIDDSRDYGRQLNVRNPDP